MNLSTPLYAISGIGPSIARRLKLLNLETVEDLLFYFPFRYDDFSQIKSALEAQIGETVTLVGEIWSIKNIYTRSRKIITQAVFNDGTSPIELTWFNQPYLTKSIKTGDKLQISGKINKYKNKLSIMAPVWEKISSQYSVVSNQTLHTGRLVPIYSETAGINSKWLRAKIALILPRVEIFIRDHLPDELRGEMLDLRTALLKIHFPENIGQALAAKDRLSFDELFFIQLATLKTRLEWQKKPLISPLTINKADINKLLKSLNFELTNAQKKVLEEILEDLTQTYPMNRIVQGEVGSGKTVVAAVAAFVAYLNNLKTLFMAPTEILAFQHFETLKKLLEPHGITVGIYTGSRKYNKSLVARVKSSTLREEHSVLRPVGSQGKQSLDSRLQTLDSPHIIVGTHALISDSLVTEDVGLVIVDEQQRFGVEQRGVLRNKSRVPHFLSLSATPIPRTVALTLYGDLDLSVIDELPKGRKTVKTYVVPAKKRADAYKFIEKKIKEEKDQVFIITPLIEESETLKSVKAAKVEFEKLQKEVFSDLNLGLLHGRLKGKEKEQIINDFKEKKLDILVSTSVVEVGVDIPNAAIMVIEGAERFGLSQLHQLRGRVGRGEKQSFCLLFTSTSDPNATSRLKNLEKISDGMALAELDLKIRGSGEIFGTKQAGRFELKIASFADLTLVQKTREVAKKLLSQDPTLDKYPQLKVKLQTMGAGVMPD